jgi:hypothetical protein
VVEAEPVSLATNFFVTSMISWLHAPFSAWATPATKRAPQMDETMLGARMAIGSHGYPAARRRRRVDRYSFENGQRFILFRPSFAHGGAALPLCTRLSIRVGAELISAGRTLCV